MGPSIWISTGRKAFLSRKCLFLTHYDGSQAVNKVVKIHLIILDHKILLRETPSTRNMAHFVLKSQKRVLMLKETFLSDEPLIKDHLQSCTSEICQLISRSLNYTIMVSVRSIRHRNIRRQGTALTQKYMPQETASLKDFNSDTSKNQIAVPNVDTLVLTTVLLNGYLFFAGCWFLQTCHNRVSEVVSCFNLEAVAACPNFRSLLSSCETNKLTRKKLSALFVRYVQFLTTLYLQDPPAS